MLKKMGGDETPAGGAAGGRSVISGLEVELGKRGRILQISDKNPRIQKESVRCSKNLKSLNLGTPLEIIQENQCLHMKNNEI